jgi:hypothetical protein
VIYHANVQGIVGLRVVSARTTKPAFVPSLSACRGHSPLPAGAVSPAF